MNTNARVDDMTVLPAMPPATDLTDKTGLALTNDTFLTAIFGSNFEDAKPLVCSLAGDPSSASWPARAWPCDTTDAGLNWYALPALFEPNEAGRYKAQKSLAGLVLCAMLDDVGTKVPLARLDACPPSWRIETSPGNFQVGYIFSEPVDAKQADVLKVALIESGLCDKGASGGSARWMRLPVAINGKPKYGSPAFQCKLVVWQPECRYSVAQIVELLELAPPQEAVKPSRKAATTDRQAQDNIYTPRPAENAVLTALKARGIYKQPLGSGKHDITCPWLHEHTDQVDHGSAYFEPSDLYPVGGFKCQHAHGDVHRIGALLAFLGVTFTAAKHKPSIKVEAGELHRIVDAAENE